jgi:D-amino-acid dehydrogenase
MKIAILGSGVIGVTTAWYLAEAGHEVTVIDRQPAAALETSFGNAGEISPGYASPWAAPGIPMKAIGWLMQRHSPLILRPAADPDMFRWLLAMLGNCTAARYAVNKERMVRLAEYSRDCLGELRDATGITYDERTQGTLQVFRTQKQLDATSKDIEVLKASGVDFELLDQAGCIAAEPGLRHSADHIVGGLRLPNDETGDCFIFTQKLASMAEKRGVRFLYQQNIRHIVADNDQIVGIETDAGPITADRYIVALGSYSAAMVKPLGLHLPVYPVKGYSITVPITDASRAPESTLLDESYKIAITRLGDRIRVGGMAEISGYTKDLPRRRKETLLKSVSELFPGSGDWDHLTYWSGLRPMTPDSTPIIGETRYSNLYLNTGHGTLGWTMACGSARLIADQISGRKTDIDTAGLSLARCQAR